MDALRAAVPLGRLLLAVGEAKRDVCIEVRGRSRVAQLRVAEGQVVALEGVDTEPLGDTLLKLGALDARRHRDAMCAGQPEGRVGAWLVAVGAAPAAAVEHALEVQLAARVGALLRWPEASFQLTPAMPLVAEGCIARVDLVCAVWQGLLGIARDLPAGTLAALSGDLSLRLTRSGERLSSALSGTAQGAELAAVLERSPRSEQRPARAALRALGAAVDGGLDADAYSLLLRKQREIRRRVSPAALLDLPPTARPEHARRALRRLAHKLHPDRFQADEPRLRVLSGEVMRALSRAEEELRVLPANRFGRVRI